MRKPIEKSLQVQRKPQLKIKTQLSLDQDQPFGAGRSRISSYVSNNTPAQTNTLLKYIKQQNQLVKMSKFQGRSAVDETLQSMVTELEGQEHSLPDITSFFDQSPKQQLIRKSNQLGRRIKHLQNRLQDYCYNEERKQQAQISQQLQQRPTRKKTPEDPLRQKAFEIVQIICQNKSVKNSREIEARDLVHKTFSNRNEISKEKRTILNQQKRFTFQEKEIIQTQLNQSLDKRYRLNDSQLLNFTRLLQDLKSSNMEITEAIRDQLLQIRKKLLHGRSVRLKDIKLDKNEKITKMITQYLQII